MFDAKYSLMILPKSNNQLLLQNIKDSSKNISYWDGFGCFYKNHEELLVTAQKVFHDNFDTKIEQDAFELVAELTFTIKKPNEIVKLYTKIYFANLYTDLPKFTASNNLNWYKFDEIPYKQMHDATGYWLPLVISKERIKANLSINQSSHHLNGVVEEFEFKKL